MYRTRIFHLIVFVAICILSEEAFGVGNEKYEVIDKSRKYSARCYFFTPIPACTGCLKNINFTIQQLNYINKDIEIVGFVSGVNDEGISLLKKNQGWDIKVINDELGLYHNYYLKGRSNVFLIIDDEGNKIDYYGTSDLSNIDSFNNSLKKLLNNAQNEKFRVLQETEIFYPDTSKRFIFGEMYSVIFSEKIGKYYFISYDRYHLIEADLTGQITDHFYFKDIDMSFCSKAEAAFWMLKDSLLVIQVQDGELIENNEYRAINYFLTFNTIKKTFKEIKINTLRNRTITSINYLQDNEFIFTDDLDYDTSKIDLNKYKPFKIYTINEESLLEKGRLPKVYFEQNLIKHIHSRFCTFGNKIYALFNYDNSIIQFDRDHNSQKIIRLEKSGNYRITKVDLPDKLVHPNEYWSDFANKVSLNSGFVFDAVNRHFLILINNLSFPDGITEYNSPNIKTSQYALLYDIDGNLISEIKLPIENRMLIDFKNHVLTYLVVENQQLKIKKIEFLLY